MYRYLPVRDGDGENGGGCESFFFLSFFFSECVPRLLLLLVFFVHFSLVDTLLFFCFSLLVDLTSFPLLCRQWYYFHDCHQCIFLTVRMITHACLRTLHVFIRQCVHTGGLRFYACIHEYKHFILITNDSVLALLLACVSVVQCLCLQPWAGEPLVNTGCLTHFRRRHRLTSGLIRRFS